MGAGFGWIFGTTGILLAGTAHSWLRYRRHGTATTSVASLSYLGWTRAFLVTLAILEFGFFGPFLLLSGFGEVVQARVEATRSSRYKGSRSYAVGASVVTDGRALSLDGEISQEEHDSLQPGDAIPFVIFPPLPAIHQVGRQPRVHPVVGAMAAIAIALFFIGYGAGSPDLDPRPEGRRRLFALFTDGLGGLLGATLEQLLELPAILALGVLIGPRLRGEALQPADLCALAVLAACLFVLLRRIVKPAPRTVEIHRAGIVRVAVPSISGFHFLFDALYLALGAGALLSPRDPGSEAVGLCLVIVPGVLMLGRALYWKRRIRVHEGS